MNIGTWNHHTISNPNSLLPRPQKNPFMGSTRFRSNNNINNLKMTRRGPSDGNVISWMELQGTRNWDGLLDPLHDALRDEILRYGHFVEAAYRCFLDDDHDDDTCPPTHRVTKCLHATCGVHLPGWADRWASARSSQIGYVAVCDDRAEIARLGRRDVVIAYRGTATPMEWAENLRVTLAGLPASMAGVAADVKVQSGLLSLYTSAGTEGWSLQELVRGEVGRILGEYGGGEEPLSITVTGHSLGAALATITAHDIRTAFGDVAPMVTVVSFGGPRVGNKHFRRQLERGGTRVLRIVNSDDPVTKVPGFVVEGAGGAGMGMGMVRRWVEEREWWWVYAEIGKELRLSSRDCHDLSNRGVATCHDLRTYLHLVSLFVSSNCPLRATAKRVLSSRAKPKQQQLNNLTLRV